MLDDGDGEIKICQNCGEAVYVEYEEQISICFKCANSVSYFEGTD